MRRFGEGIEDAVEFALFSFEGVRHGGGGGGGRERVGVGDQIR